MKIIDYSFLFFIYSLIGWSYEVLLLYFRDNKNVNRGFLIGPYCPIYGFCGLLIYLFSKGYTDNLIIVFINSIIICFIIEYISSFILEKYFNIELWNYEKEKININGRVCLNGLIIFGILGVLNIYVLAPALLYWITKLKKSTRVIIFIMLIILFLIDILLKKYIMKKEKKILPVIKDKKLIKKQIINITNEENNNIYKRR